MPQLSQSNPEDHLAYMRRALELAEEAGAEGEVPVGCVIVREGVIVGEGRNRREKDKNALAHAELEAVGAACAALGGWRLHECDIYVTLEPCPMCAGAILNARLRNVVFGARDPKAGVLESRVRLFELGFNHKPDILGGVMEEECGRLLSEFFQTLRTQRS